MNNVRILDQATADLGADLDATQVAQTLCTIAQSPMNTCGARVQRKTISYAFLAALTEVMSVKGGDPEEILADARSFGYG
jgi:hypothetical protein